MAIIARFAGLCAAISIIFGTNPAKAVCIHGGELYAKTTLDQEFAEAPIVVRARVLSARNWNSGEERGTLYHLRVISTFKGDIPIEIDFSTERNSGGFYLDADNGRPDIGADYLLFLVPNPRPDIGPSEVRQSLWVNYACGKSGRWDDINQSERAELARLSRASR